MNLDLMRAAAALERNAGRDWEVFLVVLKAHVEAKQNSLLASVTDQSIFVAQGRAQEAKEIFDTLEDAANKSDELVKTIRRREGK